MTNPSHPALLNAIHLATRKLASSRMLDDVLPEVLSICLEAVGAEGGTIYLHNRQTQALEFRHVLPESSRAALQFSDIPDDHGVAGRVFQSRKSELTQFDLVPDSSIAIAAKAGMTVSSMITVPLMLEDTEPIGIVQLINKVGGNFDENDQTVLETISAVSTLAYLNWQLLDEQTRASQLLGMGRVAHDIKNMAFALEANLQFSNEPLEALLSHASESASGNEVIGHLTALSAMVDDLKGSIERVKRYTVLMSDLSAGKRLEPTLTKGQMGKTIEFAASYLASEARKLEIELTYDTDSSAPDTLFDDMYVFRITQNLVSNAIKAVAETKATGRDQVESVVVRYLFEGDTHVLEVCDTGPGMTQDVADRILGGNARSVWNKSSGSGWGTKIVLELAHTLGGVVSIDSELGKGSAFRVVFPHRPG